MSHLETTRTLVVDIRVESLSVTNSSYIIQIMSKIYIWKYLLCSIGFHICFLVTDVAD